MRNELFAGDWSDDADFAILVEEWAEELAGTLAEKWMG